MVTRRGRAPAKPSASLCEHASPGSINPPSNVARCSLAELDDAGSGRAIQGQVGRAGSARARLRSTQRERSVIRDSSAEAVEGSGERERTTTLCDGRSLTDQRRVAVRGDGPGPSNVRARRARSACVRRPGRARAASADEQRTKKSSDHGTDTKATFSRGGSGFCERSSFVVIEGRRERQWLRRAPLAGGPP